MSLADAICEVRCTAPSAYRCHEKESAERNLASQSGCCLNSCTPSPMLAWEKGYADMLGFNNESDGYLHRRPIVLPGAWAIGDGVLLEFGEPDGSSSSLWGTDSPESFQGSFSRMAGTLSATWGSYLTNLANVITSCARNATTGGGGRGETSAVPLSAEGSEQEVAPVNKKED